jgi:hypothetical protein
MGKQNQTLLLKQMIERAEKQIEMAKKMLSKLDSGEEVDLSAIRKPRLAGESDEGEVIEGVFDGLSMVGADGRSYTMPANYASKSKLVEGDLLKLTILADGSFLYKQIGPVERKRLRGTLMQDEDTGEYTVMSQGTVYKALSASITYYKGEVGDEVVILVPHDKQSKWAAVENVIKQLGDEEMNHPEEKDEEQGALPAANAANAIKDSILDKATADLL